MMTTALALCLATVGLDPIRDKDLICDRVDLVELNHFYDEKGRLVFDQIIFYDWSPSESRFQVRDWRLLKRPAQIPHRSGSHFVAVWLDGEVLRKVQAPSLRESWTQYDPELVEREFLPKESRRKLQEMMVRSKAEPFGEATARTAANTSAATRTSR